MPAVGDVLVDRYRIESVLGVGGMGSVYRASDLRLDRQVAVKVLVANLAADPHFAERFSREAGAMAGFSHPNIAAVYDVEPGDPATGREPFYVMEYCEGGSLADRLRVSGRMRPAELIPIVSAVAEALAELHRGGLIHRDVKPANILFASDRPKLADFGVARDVEPPDGAPFTQPGAMIGTAAYLAPELASGAPATAASDVYALGVTIFLALTGQYPQPMTVGERNADAGPGNSLPVSAAAADLGTAFDAALARALDPDPVARTSPTELTGQLAAGLEIRGIASPNPDALAASDPMLGTSSGVDMSAPTVVAPAGSMESVPLPQPVEPNDAQQEEVVRQPAMPQRPVAQQPAPVRHVQVSWVWLAILATALAILAVTVLPRLQGGGSPRASTGPSAAASGAPSPTALPSSDAAVLAALGRVDAAIEAARGGKDGLNGHDANELAQLAASVRSAVLRGDFGAAAVSARALSDRARAVAASLDRPRRDALFAAVDDLSGMLAGP